MEVHYECGSHETNKGIEHLDLTGYSTAGNNKYKKIQKLQ